jgi:UDP-2,3-diacylglucosamine pyrophosphatase LpxH
MKPKITTPVHRVNSLFISDVHLGTRDSKATELNDFLKRYDCKNLFIVGDFIDGWRMQKNVYWRKSHTRVIRRILKMSKRGVNVHYITGNHDEFLRKFANNRFDNIHLVNRLTHTTEDGKRLLVIHGDQFEGVTHAHSVLKWIGDWGYDWLMAANRAFNFVRAKYGYGYWSFAAFLKHHIKRARRYILDYEDSASRFAAKQDFDGIVCGHIHLAAKKELNGVTYYNTGDWVESCTAVVEALDGSMNLVNWFEQRDQIVTVANDDQTIPEPAVARG